jgi:hypothetical protein
MFTVLTARRPMPRPSMVTGDSTFYSSLGFFAATDAWCSSAFRLGRMLRLGGTARRPRWD